MERMDMHSRNQRLQGLLGRYLRADRRAKGLLLDEYCKNTGSNRKYAIRNINPDFIGSIYRAKEANKEAGFLWQ